MTSVLGEWPWWLVVVFGLIGGYQAVVLRRMSRSLQVLQSLDDRLSRLSYSLGLLVDTTQGCFDALATQLDHRDESATTGAVEAPPAEGLPVAGPPAKAATVSRQRRQRRVVTAARRGKTVAQIAAEESVSETEVALRVQLARDLQASCELT